MCTMSFESNMSREMIEDRFLVGAIIGKGSFGKVFETKDKITGKKFAIKFMEHESAQVHLKNEYEVYKVLSGGIGIPDVICYGSYGKYDFMVLEFLGPSLERLFEFCKRRFSLKTVLMIGIKMLRRIEYVHQMSHLHRDIKPENFVIDSINGKELYLLDFGLAKRYCQFVNGRVEHIKLRQNKSFTGTVRYASISMQKCITSSRRDDLESLAYVLIYFLKGSLPWQRVPKVSKNGLTSKERKEKILEMKISMTIAQICDGIPVEFQTFLRTCREIRFEEQPKYSYLRLILENLFSRNYFEWDDRYDWNILSDSKTSTK